MEIKLFNLRSFCRLYFVVVFQARSLNIVTSCTHSTLKLNKENKIMMFQLLEMAHRIKKVSLAEGSSDVRG